jgi:hypothetical protein
MPPWRPRIFAPRLEHEGETLPFGPQGADRFTPEGLVEHAGCALKQRAAEQRPPGFVDARRNVISAHAQKSCLLERRINLGPGLRELRTLFRNFRALRRRTCSRLDAKLGEAAVNLGKLRIEHIKLCTQPFADRRKFVAQLAQTLIAVPFVADRLLDFVERLLDRREIVRGNLGRWRRLCWLLCVRAQGREAKLSQQ